MATCGNCHLDMNAATTTTCVAVPIDGHAPIPWDGEGRCHDCNVAPGGLHHPGCDVERCPVCRGQAISCGCSDTDDEDA